MDCSSRIKSVSHRQSSVAVNMDNRVLVAVSARWDVNSSMGGREDVTFILISKIHIKSYRIKLYNHLINNELHIACILSLHV